MTREATPMLYHQVAGAYQIGALLPLPAGAKTPPPGGFTGHQGIDPGPSEAQAWAEHAGNFALRVADGVVGIDVDQYGAKNGLGTLQAATDQLGPLPDTWMSTGRSPSTGSGIRFYRYPGGRLAGVLGESVEIIQHGHRYAVVWPSRATGSDGTALEYRWFKWVPEVAGIPAGWAGMNRPPRLEELPELPEAWVRHLQAGAAADAGPAAPREVAAGLLTDIVTDDRPVCGGMTAALGIALDKLHDAGDGGRHDAATAGTLLLVSTASEGHSGFSEALAEYEAAWHEAIGHDPGRAGEFERMVNTAVAKAASKHPRQTTPVGGHLCERAAAQTPGDFGLAPVVTPGGAGAIITGPPVLPGLPEVFDPHVLQESDLAQAVLSASLPIYRFASDEKAWYRRDDKLARWERDAATKEDGARGIIARVGAAAPRGNRAADKGTPEQVQAERWALPHTSSRRGAIAKLMVDTADAWRLLRASDMDADPTVLWAGGYCWDLAASAEGRPVLADVDLLTPHYHSAAVLPKVCPTPLWDAMLAAIFPDADERDYLMGVLGAATTGTSDRILGVFYGDRLMGKTSVLKVVSGVLGTYARALDPDLLDARRSNDFKVMSLKGIRLGWVDEGPSNNKLGQERLKALTGGGTLVGAFKGKQAVTFDATHALFFTDNREPDVSDDALRSRVRALRVHGDPTDVKRSVKAIRANMGRWLATEGPGVLAQLIMWAGRYLEDDTVADMPEHIHIELEALGREQDPVLSWLDERTEPGGETGSTELYADFKAHADASGVPRSLVPSLTTWGRKVSDMGYIPRKTNGVKVRPLVLRQRYGTMGWNTPPQLSAAVPNPPLEPSPAQTVPEAVAVPEPVTVPGVPELSITETPSQTPIMDSRDSRDTIKGGEKCKKGGKKEENITRAHIRACAGEAVPGGCAEGVPLPAALQRGGEPFAVTLADARALLSTLGGQRVTVDVETSGYPVGHRHYQPKTIQLGNRHWAVVLDAADADQLSVAVQTMDAAAELQAHSANADVSPVALAAGVDSAPWWDKTTDTAVLAALAPAELTGLHQEGALGLKELSKRLLPDAVAPAADRDRAALFRKMKCLTNPTPLTPPERNGWNMVDPSDPVMVTYAASDVLDTDDVREHLPTPPTPLLHRERRLQAVLARLPERGLRLDADRVAALKAEHEADRDAEAAKLAAQGLAEPTKNAAIGEALMALGAQLPLTKTGKPSTAAEVIERLAEAPGAVGQLVTDLLAFREHEKLLSTYLLPFGLQCTQGDGRARPTILTLGAAATGRMSSVRPNIQQVPRPTKAETKPGGGGGMRGMFLADDGMRFIAADFSSVEVRIAAAITGDATLAHMVREGIDLHGEVVKLAWGYTEDHPLFQDVRYLAKRAVFGYLYGAGLKTMAKQLGAHGDKAQAVVDALKAITPGLIEYDRGLRRAVETGQLTHWVHPSGRVAWFNQAMPHKSLNMIVQGYGRELLVDAIERWEAMHPGHTIVPIHDELVIQCESELAEQYTEDLVACMTTTIGTGAAQVPIVAEADPPTRRWGTVE